MKQTIHTTTMITLKTRKSLKKGQHLKKEIGQYIEINPKIIFKPLRRPVFLTRYLEATDKRADRNKRRQKFFPALELIKTSKKMTISNKTVTQEKKVSYELKGTMPDGDLVGVHIREEIENKDKTLYLISTF